MVPVVVAAPRGFAKTTLVSFGYVLHQVLFGQRRFVVIGSDTADLVEGLCGHLRLELMHNQRLRQDFGHLYDSQGSQGDFIAGAHRRAFLPGARGSGSGA